MVGSLDLQRLSLSTPGKFFQRKKPGLEGFDGSDKLNMGKLRARGSWRGCGEMAKGKR